uniref:Uncharacterized protein n=1 Tax=Meloidogyne floridensis TaxID=298350 RepID=A0A915NVU1_9BILA
MKINKNIIIYLLLVISLFLNFVLMVRRSKIKKRLTMSGSNKSYSIYIKKLKLFVERERGKNNCNQKIDKDLNPNEQVQKELVEYYENTNEQFAKALKLIKNRSKVCISILDRTNDIQLNVNNFRKF